tara:strand:- start:31 stop:303 length:273 start_codon:yes stop_codon:yes gene_type:complete
MSYFILVLLRVLYWISFYLVIAAFFGYEDSVLNPTEEGVASYATMGILFAVIGGLSLRRNVAKHGWNLSEISTLFTSVVASLGITVFGAS